MLRATGATASVGLIAGCLTKGDGTDEAEADGSYSVTMEPVGTVEFDSVPEAWVPYTGDYADMGVALGQADGLSAIGIRARYGTHYYDEIPGVSVDESELTELWQGSTDREIFYALEADVHVIDPNFMINRLGWDQGKIDEIENGVAPFVGNTIFSGSYPWHDYAQYTLYEAFEKIADLFQARDRYEAFASLHDEVLADVQSRLPDERPDVAILFPAEVPPESFYPYVIDDGTQSKQWNDLGVGRALAESHVADFHESRGTIDYETLLEVDPDVIAIRQDDGVIDEDFESQIVDHMKDHSVAKKLTAVQTDRVIPGGMIYQGPIINLFQLEDAAQRLFPDEFGGEELFDRAAVGDIVAEDS
ncbi:hypothetical protein C479_11230 [Halovivax asiaticus JCM 14624]|uniref:Fe/B12 periplasmic-binding domain-containing protein n=1 Tax=Halovivax asiaticus JCM 14624 TaxID=1227490 RepID=M0BEW8_9EURY|nr:hypothetical protein C479_11230 [Halovivax asiaticus JCM 14624]